MLLSITILLLIVTYLLNSIILYFSGDISIPNCFVLLCKVNPIASDLDGWN